MAVGPRAKEGMRGASSPMRGDATEKTGELGGVTGAWLVFNGGGAEGAGRRRWSAVRVEIGGEFSPMAGDPASNTVLASK